MGYRSAPNKLKRPLTTEERQQVDALSDALDTAWSQLGIRNWDDRVRIRAEVEAAHPLSPEVHEVYSRELEMLFGDGLQWVESQISPYKFKPDAPWGMAIYRTAYGDDAAWKRMLDDLQETVEWMQYQRAPNPELFLRHYFEIMDDQSQFEDATIDGLCENFRAWAIEDYRANCREDHRPSVEELKAGIEGRGDHNMSAPRHNFFMVVDDICLESMEQSCGAVVKLVQRGGCRFPGWELTAEDIQEMGPRKEDSEWDGGVTESEFEDVGWMYMETGDYVVMQDLLDTAGDWEDHYLRPPQLRFYDGFEDTPGSWRK